MNKKMRTFLNFGEMTLKSIITYLYFAGCVIIIYKAFHWGKSIYLSNIYDGPVRYIKNARWWVFTDLGVSVMGFIGHFIGFIAYFIVASLIWKLICELLYIIFERIAKK